MFSLGRTWLLASAWQAAVRHCHWLTVSAIVVPSQWSGGSEILIRPGQVAPDPEYIAPHFEFEAGSLDDVRDLFCMVDNAWLKEPSVRRYWLVQSDIEPLNVGEGKGQMVKPLSIPSRNIACDRF